VETEFNSVSKLNSLFQTQDDWLFHTRGDFIHQSIEILLHVTDVMVVWCASSSSLLLSSLELSDTQSL